MPTKETAIILIHPNIMVPQSLLDIQSQGIVRLDWTKSKKEHGRIKKLTPRLKAHILKERKKS